tara:strand:+ start:257 stop:409 length:153 start_codon:yes stop_codon:yes gene_type:complete
MLQLGIAKELGYTLYDLKRQVSEQELFIWAAYFELLNEDQERRLKSAKRM